jgi:cysteine desulfurase/selenocysteine lyase
MTTSNTEDDYLQKLAQLAGGSEPFDAASPLSLDLLSKMANAFMQEQNFSFAPAALFSPASVGAAVPTNAPLSQVDAAIPASVQDAQSVALQSLAGIPGADRAVAATSLSVVDRGSPGELLSVGSQASDLPAAANLGSASTAAPYVGKAVQPFGFLDEIRSLVPFIESASGDLESLAAEFEKPGSYRAIRSELDLQQKGSVADHDFLKGLTSAIEVSPSLAPLGEELPVALSPGLLSAPFDVNTIRRDFPILQEKVFGSDLVWFDNAATTQKPQAVIDRLNYFYSHENSNIHRSAHYLAAKSSDAYENARHSVRRFLNARSLNEIVFVRGATEAINLVAQSWGRQNLAKDDEVVISWLEHHANIVPWQIVCAETGARLRVAPVNDNGDLILEEFERILSPRTKFVSITQVSNALGTVTPVAEIVAAAHRFGAKVLVDGAQSVSHMGVDVQQLDCDFFVFSGHKVYAPTGIGVLYGKEEVLNGLPPWQGGGNMIHDVTFERTVYQPAPARFEAGTGNIADAVGLSAAIDYISRIGMKNIAAHEEELLDHAQAEIAGVPGLQIIGRPKKRAGVLSFVLNGFRTDEVSQYLNQQGIAVRSGHHCAQPILRRLGVESSVRPSFGVYNTCEEVDKMVDALLRLTRGRRS